MNNKQQLKEAVEAIRKFQEATGIEILNEKNITNIIQEKQMSDVEPEPAVWKAEQPTDEETTKEKIRMKVEQRLQELEKIFNKLLEHY